MKRFSATLATILGFIGILLFTTLIVGVWLFNATIYRSINALLVPVDALIISVDAKVTTLDARVTTLQDDVIADVLAKTHTLKTAPPDVEIDTTTILEEIEKRLEPTLASFQSELSALEPQIQATVNILRLIKNFLPQDAQTMIEANISVQITSMSANLAAIQGKLKTQKTALSSITVNTDIERIETLEAPIQELNTGLNDVETLLQRLDTVLGDVQAFTVDTKRRIGLYATLAAVVMTLLSLWALWANIALFERGRQS